MATRRWAAPVASAAGAPRRAGRASPWPVVALLLSLAAGCAGLYGLTDGLSAWTLDQRREARIAARTLRLPAIDTRDQRGQPLRLFGAASAAGQPVYIVDFIYTRCLTVCRALGAEFTQLQHQAEADGLAGRISLVSLSFDPRDDIANLAGYAREHRARLPGWAVAAPVFQADMQALLRRADVIAIPDGLGGFEHNGGLHVVDATGKVLAVYPLAEFQHAYAFARRQLSPQGWDGGARP